MLEISSTLHGSSFGALSAGDLVEVGGDVFIGRPLHDFAETQSGPQHSCDAIRLRMPLDDFFYWVG